KKRIILGTYILDSDNYESCFVKAQKARTLICDDFEKAFEKFDILISPTSPTTAFKIGSKMDTVSMYFSDIYTVPINLAGLPAITVPCGFSQGLPIGVQFIGKAFDEKTLIKTAYNFEQNTDYHKKRPEHIKQ
ncbi:MAG TPA: Asp-tRNA(Asn)/Glu-tRNA(Gln) amidotransferase subunit GatA, partial [Thermoanaerobacterales bacterium]|nr:Asp-tRNA(Asn)/Glu-tRNA(Gln) amidotransferase subunit GatA [Thermoanaerobacterales bacterium]